MLQLCLELYLKKFEVMFIKLFCVWIYIYQKVIFSLYYSLYLLQFIFVRTSNMNFKL